MSSNIEDDINWCMDILDDVSRTFSVPIKMIDNPRSKYICVGYLVCRISDTIEDDPNMNINDKNLLFNKYANCIVSKNKDDIDDFIRTAKKFKPDDPEVPAYWDLVLNTDRLFNVYSSFDEEVQDCIDKPAIEMIHGMKTYCNKYPDGMRFKTLEELDKYCYFVAGTVGNMLSNLSIYHNELTTDKEEKLRYHAQKYGLLLQLVNIIKDINEDYVLENNIYIPSNKTDEYNITQENIADKVDDNNSKLLVNDLIEHAESNIKNAREYLKLLDDIEYTHMPSWSIPYLLSIATLREMNENYRTVLTEGGVKMTRDEVYSVINSVKDSDYNEITDLENKIYKKPLNEY